MATIGGRLREERQRTKLNQTDFASKGGVGLGSQIRYESDERRPDADYLAAIAVIGADIAYIVTGVRCAAAEATKTPPRQLTEIEEEILEGFWQSDANGRATLLGVVRMAKAARPEECPSRDDSSTLDRKAS